jgi:putative nucleotidyltransferase with HDIG domain
MTIKNNLDKSKKQKLIQFSKKIYNKEFWEKIYKSSNTYKLLLLIFVGIVLTIIISPHVVKLSFHYRSGAIALKNIKAPQNFLVEDKLSTEKREIEAENSIPLIFDYDPGIFIEIKKRMNSAFSYFYTFYNNPVLSGKLSLGKNEFEKILGIKISDNCFKTLEKYNFHFAIKNQILNLIKPIYKKGVLDKKEGLLEKEGKETILRNIRTKEEIAIKDLQEVYAIEEAKSFIKQNLTSPFKEKDKAFENALNLFASLFVKQSLNFNKNETEERKLQARKNISPVFFQIARGEMIIREGDKITEEHLIKLRALKELQEEEVFLSSLFGLFFIIIFMLFFLYYFVAKYISKIISEFSDLVFLSTLLLFLVIIVRLSVILSEAINQTFPLIPINSVLYGIPFAIGAMLVCVVKEIRVAFIFSAVLGVICSLLLENNLEFFIYPFLGSLVSILVVTRCEQRSKLIKAGIYVGLVNICLIFCFKAMEKQIFGYSTLIDISFGMFGGIISGIIVTGLISIVESVFGYTTDIKLLELMNLNHPLLKQLAIKSPGTYNHSILVGGMAEAAAEAINARPLMSRVSSYYHDIGKLTKPLYFIENQGGENKHDRLTPSMSSLVLIAHVKNGADFAKEHKLGREITDIIKQHHGTSLITYFFQKAIKIGKPHLKEVDEKDYRYPGPKPQTKEAGLVMLADAVEASSKSLTNPTAARIQGLVQRIINSIFIDGQLNECELTLKDLHLIARSFNRVLGGVFHHRVDYKEVVQKISANKKKLNEQDIDREKTEEDKNQYKPDQKSSQSDIKRLGIQ